MAVFLRIKNVLQKRMETRRRTSPAPNRDHGQVASVSVRTPEADSKGVDDWCTPLTVQEFEEAEIAILRFVQSQSFSKEFDALRRISGEDDGDQRGRAKRKKMVLKKESSLTRLDPFVFVLVAVLAALMIFQKKQSTLSSYLANVTLRT